MNVKTVFLIVLTHGVFEHPIVQAAQQISCQENQERTSSRLLTNLCFDFVRQRKIPIPAQMSVLVENDIRPGFDAMVAEQLVTLEHIVRCAKPENHRVFLATLLKPAMDNVIEKNTRFGTTSLKGPALAHFLLFNCEDLVLHLLKRGANFNFYFGHAE